MPAEVLALVAAMAWAVDSILVRLGARSSNVVAAAFLSYCVTACCGWFYVFTFVPLHRLGSTATIYFVLSGCLQPLLARLFYYIGMTRLGVARSGPLLGTMPLFGVILAVAFLKELPTISVYGGTVFTVTSIWLVSSGESGEGEWRGLDLLFPLGAAFFAAVSQNLRKAGLLVLTDPFVGAAISTSTSLTLFSIFLLVSGRIRLTKIHKVSLPFFGSAAVVSTTAQLLTFFALSRGEASVVIPLLNTNPIFALLLSALFLKGLEKITPRIVLGAVLMVFGVILITSR